jgi:putative transposase
MSQSFYSEINLHLTWHTKANLPVLTPRIEDRLYSYLQHRILETKGVILHAIGGTEDHVHVGVSVPPTLLISEWVGRLKGASSYYVNHEVARRRLLEWQRGYGVVCFPTARVDWVVRYILNQKEHHARGTTVDRLEKIEG